MTEHIYITVILFWENIINPWQKSQNLFCWRMWQHNFVTQVFWTWRWEPGNMEMMFQRTKRKGLWRNVKIQPPVVSGSGSVACRWVTVEVQGVSCDLLYTTLYWRTATFLRHSCICQAISHIHFHMFINPSVCFSETITLVISIYNIFRELKGQGQSLILDKSVGHMPRLNCHDRV